MNNIQLIFAFKKLVFRYYQTGTKSTSGYCTNVTLSHGSIPSLAKETRVRTMMVVTYLLKDVINYREYKLFGRYLTTTTARVCVFWTIFLPTTSLNTIMYVISYYLLLIHKPSNNYTYTQNSSVNKYDAPTQSQRSILRGVITHGARHRSTTLEWLIDNITFDFRFSMREQKLISKVVPYLYLGLMTAIKQPLFVIPQTETDVKIMSRK